MHRFALVFAAGIALASVACAAPSEPEPSAEGETAQAQQAQTATNFICNENGCVCNDDTGSSVDSCVGMERVCRALGKGSLCSPDGWCHCRFDAIGGAASTTPSLPTRPIKGIAIDPRTVAAAR